MSFLETQYIMQHFNFKVILHYMVQAVKNSGFAH